METAPVLCGQQISGETEGQYTHMVECGLAKTSMAMETLEHMGPHLQFLKCGSECSTRILVLPVRFSGDMELIEPGSTDLEDAVAASGILISTTYSVHDDLVQTGIKASRRTPMLDSRGPKPCSVVRKIIMQIVLYEKKIECLHTFVQSSRNHERKSCRQGTLKLGCRIITLIHREHFHYRGKLRDEDGYRTLVRWAYEQDSRNFHHRPDLTRG